MVASLVSCLILFITHHAAHISSAGLNYSWPWFELGTAQIPVAFMLDSQSLVMMVMVVSISTLIHIYSAGYMVHDASQGRFFCLLGLFTFAMTGLVASGNVLLIFFFWELVGVTSYLLIGHHRTKTSAVRAASKAFLFNRIGDVGFIAGLMIIWQGAGSFDINELASGEMGWTSMAGLCIFGGAIAKSAQLPLMTWLPDAMEGPTPVSALIHSATMVAAGVYILVRLQFLFHAETQFIIAVIGGTTAIYSGWLATRQTDIKKILAYSTISQLGIMMIAIGMDAFDGAFLHLITHGFFKACLFLCAGALIYSIANARHIQDIDAQDVRNMGGLRPTYPMLFLCFCIAGSSLAGVPLLSGFVSKEGMLVGMLSNVNHWTDWIFIGAFMIASLLTVLYTYRMIRLIFFGPSRTSRLQPVAAVMQVPALILAGFCFWFFYSFNPFAHTAWFQQLSRLPGDSYTSIGLFSAAWVIISLVLAFAMYRKMPQISEPGLSPLDRLYARLAVMPVRAGSFTTWIDNRVIDRFIHRFVYAQVALAKISGQMDRYVVDGGVKLVGRTVRAFGNLSRSMVKGQVQSYIFWAVAGFIALIFWFLK
jgi:NADH-quinone oxidoreductase subunit L